MAPSSLTRPQTSGATTFATAIGRCGLTWSESGICSVELPQAKPADLKRLLIDHLEPMSASTAVSIATLDDAPREIRDAAMRIAAVTHGADDDLVDVRLDETSLSDFARAIYSTLRKVPPGDTITYGDLAHRAGYHSANMPRAIGQVMGRNPFGIVVPCHRVVAANGRLGGYSAHGGTATKLRLLRAEARGDAAPDMPYDVAAGRRFLHKADPELARIIDRVGPLTPRMRVASSTVAGLAEAIVGQQVSGAAAASIFARLCLLFPRPLDGPTAAGLTALSDTDLRGAGLSASKVASLRDLSTRALAGEVPDLDELAGMDDDEIVAALTPVRGIGRWTIEMLLIFRLGRPDVLPVDDLAVRRGFAFTTGRPQVTASELQAHGDRWRPWRSLASWYLWRASEMS